MTAGIVLPAMCRACCRQHDSTGERPHSQPTGAVRCEWQQPTHFAHLIPWVLHTACCSSDHSSSAAAGLHNCSRPCFDLALPRMVGGVLTANDAGEGRASPVCCAPDCVVLLWLVLRAGRCRLRWPQPGVAAQRGHPSAVGAAAALPFHDHVTASGSRGRPVVRLRRSVSSAGGGCGGGRGCTCVCCFSCWAPREHLL